ncbi:MAG TPA: peptidoglycan DD-metalloendopeptidase family protein [Peptococcaceae bacterium]|nr:peptidoglycan DD-metalloendopeptidase family protein [Peptococcaceae bacterium]
MFPASRTKTIIIAVLLVFCLVWPVSADELNDAIRRQQEILQQQSRAAGQLNNLTIKAQQTEKQIMQLTQQISAAEKDLEKKEKAYAEAQENVRIIKEVVEQKQKELEGRQETLRKRVRAIYEDGQVSYLEVLFQSTDISDFLSRVEYLSCLVENDQAILADIRRQKQELDDKQVQLIAKMEEAEKLRNEAEALKQYLASTKAKKEIALAENKKDQEELLIQIEKLEKDAKELEGKIRELQKQNKGINGSITVWPTPGYQYITSTFGYRIHPITRKQSLHTGIDIGAPNRAKIVAAGNGIVIFSGWYGAYGNAVIIDHGNGLSTLYGHMSSRAVSYGQEVVPGQVIGYVGSTGWSTGPHLHFEVRKDGVPTSPLAYY